MARDRDEDFYEEFQLQHVKNQPKFEHHGRCIKCLFWQSLKEGFPTVEQNVRGRKGDNIGECRFNAPTVPNADTQWPITFDFDWCGQFNAKAGTGGLASM